MKTIKAWAVLTPRTLSPLRVYVPGVVAPFPVMQLPITATREEAAIIRDEWETVFPGSSIVRVEVREVEKPKKGKRT